ncbi:hypothetical protein [Azospirillum argentinense]
MIVYSAGGLIDGASFGDKARLDPLPQAVVVGGIRVEPGDLIIGGDDGVVVIPLADLDEVASVSREKEAKEEEFRSRFRAGGATTWDLFGAPIPVLDACLCMFIQEQTLFNFGRLRELNRQIG